MLKNIILFFICLFMSYNAVAEKAPDFTLKTQAGETISLSDYKGKPLILHFWATWCPYCKKLQPGLNRLYTKYKKQGLEMLAISLWEDEGATPQAVLNSRGYKLTTVINGDKLSKKYKVAGTPTTFFISKTGQIVFSTSNSNPDAPELEQAIKMILK